MKASDNPFPSLLLQEQSTPPAAPASGFQREFIDATDHKVKRVDSTGAVVIVEGGGGGGGGAPAWQDYTPALTGTTTNPSLGTDGSIAGRYVQNGTTVSGWAEAIFGTTGVSAGSGAYEITLPVAMRAASMGNPAKHSAIGTARLYDNGGNGTIIGIAFVIDSATTSKVRIAAPSVAQVTNSAPFAWGAGDRIYIEFTYEADTSSNPGSTPAADLSTYARVAGTATAPHVQVGPTTKTLNSGTGGTYPGVVGFQNNAPDAPDSATRVYVVPRAKPTTGVGGVIKIFGDPYFDGGDYRDFGIYHSADQNGGAGADTGQNGTGVFWLNSKVNGTSYTGKNPDIGFSFQDGGTIAGRWSYISSTQAVLVVGAGKPEHSAKRSSIKLEVQGDIGFDGAADRAIYWENTAGSSVNVLGFERVSGGGQLRVKLGGSQKALFTQSGDLVLGDQSADLAVTSTVGFLHVRSTNGTPTGVPTTYSGAVPMLVDRAGSKLWAYIGGAWKSVTFA